MNILNTSSSNNNIINTFDDVYNNYNTCNNTFRSVKTKNYMKKFNNSYLINNNMKRNLNNISLNNSKSKKKNNKLNIVSLSKNIKKRLSPEIKGNVFIKKYFRNKKYSKDKFTPINISYRNKSIDSYKIKQTIIKSCSSNYMKNIVNANTSRGNINRNNLLNIYTPINANIKSYNSFIDNKPFTQQRKNISYIYKKKK